MSIVSILYQICIILLITYILFGLFLFIFPKSFIYYPDNQDMTSCTEFTNYEFIVQNNTRMLYKEGTTNTVLVFYHGNFGSVCDRSYVKTIVEKTNHSILFPEYTGFSNDVNKPSKKAILENVHDVNSFIQEKNIQNITLIGESLGSGAASYHSTISDIQQIILISPFSSITDIARQLYPVYPVSLLVTENFDNIQWLENYTRKVSIFHGADDVDVPAKLSKKLFDSVKTQHKYYIVYENRSHNDLWHSKEFREDLFSEIK